METRIHKILLDIQPAYSFEEGVNFIEQGYLDSFDVVTLVAELEEKFAISISALDIIPENFSSVVNISALVQRSVKKNK